MKLACSGLLLGGAGAAAAARVLKGLLFQVQPEDPIALIAVTGLVMGLTILACYLPARRASRTDSLASLRTE
jgi:putative ABC transport system permease protein